MVFAQELGIKVGWDDRAVSRGISHTKSEVRGFMSDIKQSMAQGIGQSLGQIGFTSIIQGVRSLGSQMLSANAQWEDFNTQFEVMLGSSDKAKTFMKDLQTMAVQTPFETTDLAAVSKVLLAFGNDAKEIIPIMKTLGDISLGDREKFNSMAFAFARIKSNGRLMGEELNMLIDRGFNPLTIIAEKTGTSMVDLRKQMERGAISSDMVADAFNTATSEGGQFFNGMAKGAQTFNGLKSTLQDAVAILIRELGEPFFKRAKEGLIKVIDYVSSESGQNTIKNLAAMAGKAALFAGSLLLVTKGFFLFKNIVSVFSGIGTALTTMAGHTGVMVGLGKGATMAAGAMGYLKIALSALMGPVGIVIGVISALGIAYANNFAGFRDWVNGMLADFQSFAGEIAGYFSDFASENQEIIDWLKTEWESIRKVLEVVFKAMMISAKGAWETLKTIIRTALNAITGTIKFWKQVFQGDWESAWATAGETLTKVWNGFVVIVWNSVLTILKIIDQFGDFFAKMSGQDFTGLNNSIRYVEEMVKSYESTVKKVHENVRGEVKKTAEAQKKAAKDVVKEQVKTGISGGPNSGTKTQGGSEKTSSQLTSDIILGLARGIQTPKGQASCAYFASELLQRTGSKIGTTAGAKALIDKVRAAGGYNINASQAQAGDLVYYFGKNYGAKNNRNFSENGQRGGYHVGIYRGDGTVIDSSDGKVRTARSLGRDARFIRPSRTGKYANTEETSKQAIQEYSDSLEKQNQLQRQHRQAMEDIWREQLRINGATASEILQWEYKRGLYPDLTEAQFKQRLEAVQYNEALHKQNGLNEIASQKVRQLNEDVRSYIEQSKQEIATSGLQTEQEKILWEIREGRYKSAIGWQKMFLVVSAKALDQDRLTRAGLESYKNAIKEIDQAMSDLGKTSKESSISKMILGGMTREQAEEVFDKNARLKGATAYAEKMKELSDRMREFSLTTQEASIQQLMLDENMTRIEAETIVRRTRQLSGAEAYRNAIRELNKEMLGLVSTEREWQIQQLMSDENMTRVQAEEIVNRKKQIEELKKYRELIKDIAQKTTDVFMGAIGKIGQGFSSVYRSIIDGFRKMLMDMSLQYVQSQVYKFIFGAIDKTGNKKNSTSSVSNQHWGNTNITNQLLGGIFGGIFGGFRKRGGHMNARGIYVVGENGPELIQPNTNSHVYSNEESKAMISSANSSSSGTIINLGGITINGVQDHDSFKRNQGQIAADLQRMLEKAARRNR